MKFRVISSVSRVWCAGMLCKNEKLRSKDSGDGQACGGWVGLRWVGSGRVVGYGRVDRGG